MARQLRKLRKRYFVSLSHVVPEEKRDAFRSLSKPETYRPVRVGRTGERAVYTVELTRKERERAEAASNVDYLEAVGPALPNNVDSAVPSDVDLRSHEADMLYEWGFTGEGIDVGIIDDGLPSALRGKFNVKAMRREPALGGGSPTENYHGGATASLAVPRGARLAFSDAGLGGSVSLEAVVSAIYWLVDEVGIHVLSTSSGGVAFGPYQTHADAVAHAKSEGVIVISSAGNDGSASPSYPGSYAGVISVGALDRAAGWKRWAGSNYGPEVDLWMNGVNVAIYNESGQVALMTGTSFAGPLAAYVKAALLTKGLNTIGEIGVNGAVVRGGDPAPTGIGGDPSPSYDPTTGDPNSGGSSGRGGRRVNGRNAAFAMREFC